MFYAGIMVVSGVPTLQDSGSNYDPWWGAKRTKLALIVGNVKGGSALQRLRSSIHQWVSIGIERDRDRSNPSGKGGGNGRRRFGRRAIRKTISTGLQRWTDGGGPVRRFDDSCPLFGEGLREV